MKVAIREISGNWDKGFVLDKHTVSSTCVGHTPNGHPVFETTRTEVGEAAYQLKYRSDWNQVQPLAQQLADSIYPLFGKVGFIVPMPASSPRTRQPVTEVARALSKILNIPVFEGLLLKTPNGKSLKDLATKEEKIAAIGDSFNVQDQIVSKGQWNVLLVDDLFHTGASAQEASKALRTYGKVNKIYVAALTWR